MNTLNIIIRWYTILQIRFKIACFLSNERDLENFYRFECDSFFRGTRLAEMNTKTYYRKSDNNTKLLKSIILRIKWNKGLLNDQNISDFYEINKEK